MTYRVKPADPLVDAALDVARKVLLRGHIAHILVIPGSALVQAHSADDGRTVLGAVRIPEQPGETVEAFLSKLP